jgi:hypothetical protein
MSRKTEANTSKKDGGKRRTIKKPNRKRGRDNKKTEIEKR